MVQASASGGAFAEGIANESSSNPIMTFDTVTASGAASETLGMYNFNSVSPTIAEVTATASGSSPYVVGVMNDQTGVVLNQVTAGASGAGNTYGVYNTPATGGPWTVKINHSEIVGATNTIHNTAVFTTDVGGSLLNGGTTTGGGTFVCIDSYTGSYTALSATCT